VRLQAAAKQEPVQAASNEEPLQALAFGRSNGVRQASAEEATGGVRRGAFHALQAAAAAAAAQPPPSPRGI